MTNKDTGCVDDAASFTYNDSSPIRDDYEDVPNELNGKTVEEISRIAVEMSGEYIRREGYDPATFTFPRNRQGRTMLANNPGYQYLSEQMPRFQVWCSETSTSARVASLYCPEEAVLRDGKGLGEEGVRFLQKLPEAKDVRRRRIFMDKMLAGRVATGESWMSAPSGDNKPVLDVIAGLSIDKRPDLLTSIDYSPTDMRAGYQAAAQAGLGGIARQYCWRNLLREEFSDKQSISKAIAPLLLKQRPWLKLFFADTDIADNSFDMVMSLGWFPYSLTMNGKKSESEVDEAMARHLGQYIRFAKSGGTIVFDDSCETPGSGDVMNTVAGWPLMANRNVDRLLEGIIRPNYKNLADIQVHEISTEDERALRMVILKKT